MVQNSAKSHRGEGRTTRNSPSLNVKAAALVSVLGLQLAPFADLLGRLGLGSYSEEVHAKSVTDLARHPGLAERLAERRDCVAETAESDRGGKGTRGGDGEKAEDEKTDFLAAERAVAEWASSQGVSFAAVHTLNETLPTGALFQTPERLAHCQAFCAGLESPNRASRIKIEKSEV